RRARIPMLRRWVSAPVTAQPTTSRERPARVRMRMIAVDSPLMDRRGGVGAGLLVSAPGRRRQGAAPPRTRTTEDAMSARLLSRPRGAPAVLACLLLAGAAGCQPNDGLVGGPDPGTPPPAPATGVKGVVFLTHDMSSAGVPVLMIWQEVQGPDGVGDGV